MNSPEIGKTIDAAGIRTNYLEQGSGPALVLLHGSGPGVTSYANWRLAMPLLAPDFRVVAPDIVGFGYTERPEGFDYTLDRWIDHLVGFLDGLKIERAHFIGNSFGGALSLALACRHPDRVDRLVLMGAAGLRFAITDALEAVWGYEPSEARMRALMDLFAYDRSLLTPELIASRYAASIRPGYQQSYARMFAAPRQEKLDALATPEEDVARITQRTLIVHGRDDQVIPLANSIRLNQLIDGSDLHVFGRCGHWTQVEKVDPFCALVTEFLQRP